MEECGSGIKEIDNDQEVRIDLIPLLQEALDHLQDLEFEREGLVYRSKKWRLIVRIHDDHVPIFNINKWGYGKIYFYVPNEEVKDFLDVLRREIEEEIRRIKELYQEFCEKKEGEKGMENPGGEKYGVFQ